MMPMLVIVSVFGGGGRKGKGGSKRSPDEHQRDLQLVRHGSDEGIAARLECLLPQAVARIRQAHPELFEDAEDIAQEVIVSAIRPASGSGGIRDFRGDCSLRTWFIGNVDRRAISHLRATTAQKRDRRKEVPIAELPRSLPDGGSSPGETAYVHESRTVLAAAVARLPDHLRAVVELCDIEGLTYEKAAEVLGIRKGTVSSRLLRAREKLKGDKHLRSYYLSDENASDH